MPATTSRPTSTTSAERGAGVVAAIVGVTVFLTLLLFAAELAVGLYATSAVTGVGFDAARSVAAGGEPLAAEARARHVLDRFEHGGGRLTFRWVADDEMVALTVVADRP